MQDRSCARLLRAEGQLIRYAKSPRTLLFLGGHLPLLTWSRPLTVSFPRMFSASQTYSPASSTFTLLNCSREFFLVWERKEGERCDLGLPELISISHRVVTVKNHQCRLGEKTVPQASLFWSAAGTMDALDLGGDLNCQGNTDKVHTATARMF